MIGNADGGRPPRIRLGGWEFDHYHLSPDSYPAVERYRLANATAVDGMRAYVELDHGGSWKAHFYPGTLSTDQTVFTPADSYAMPTDALAVLVSELHNRGFGGER